MNMALQWNDTDRGFCPSDTLNTTNPTWSGVGSKSCLRGERPTKEHGENWGAWSGNGVWSCRRVSVDRSGTGLQRNRSQRALLRSGHKERGLPQRTAVSVRCGMLHSKQTFKYYILKAQFLSNKKKPLAFW